MEDCYKSIGIRRAGVRNSVALLITDIANGSDPAAAGQPSEFGQRLQRNHFMIASFPYPY